MFYIKKDLFSSISRSAKIVSISCLVKIAVINFYAMFALIIEIIINISFSWKINKSMCAVL